MVKTMGVLEEVFVMDEMEMEMDLIRNKWTRRQEEYYSSAAFNQRNPAREGVALALLQRHLQPPAVVCDVGCGSGDLVKSLSELGYTAVGLDLPRVARGCSNVHPQLTFHSFDAEREHLPLCEGVIALELLEHLVHDFDFLLRCAEVCKVIVLCVPVNDNVKPQDHHLRYYPKHSLEKLLVLSGFQVVDYRVDNCSQFFVGVRRP